MEFADSWARLKDFLKLYITLLIAIGSFIVVSFFIGVVAKADATLMMANATITLVIVTSIYTVLYYRILMEMQKSREIQYIEHRLEKFYAPLLNNDIFWKENYAGFKQHAFGDVPNSENHRQMKEFLNITRKYSHLTSGNIEPFLYQLKIIIKSGANNLEPANESEDVKFDRFKKNLESVLKEDYDSLKHDLVRLVSQKL